MANEKDNYKEGVDFKWVDKGGYKTRKFLTKAEKDAAKAPKAAAPTPKAKVAPKAAAPKAKDAMQGYRKGDVTTSKLPNNNVVGAKAGAGSNVGARKSSGAKVTSEQRMPVPGAAIGRAIKNAFSGKGETDAAKISASGGTTLSLSAPKAKSKVKTTAKRNINSGGQYATVAYAKGGMAKKGKC